MVRVRFAPSPTGYLHLGSARTALFNWLYARRTGGKLILRIEDTDKERSRKEFLEQILQDLRWMGIDWDQGPFFQSEREALYAEAAKKILEKGLAYKEGEAVIYKVEKGQTIKIDDLVHGEISFNTDEIKDQVLIKSNGTAAYNFACVVDDAQMNITHIIRGDDHISNTPKQIMFYQALELKKPHFAHLPLMMGKDGAKLSKRHGGVAVGEYRQEGFLPQALVNYLLLLGWLPEGEKEIISLSAAAKQFDLKGINDAQAKFDLDKLKWLNGEYIMAENTERLTPILKNILVDCGVHLANVDEQKLKTLIDLYKIRIKTLTEFFPLTDYFFKDDYEIDEKGKRKYLEKNENKQNIKIFMENISRLTDFSQGEIEQVCRSVSEQKQVKPADLIHPARMAISGKTRGAGLFEIMELLGRDTVLERMRKASC